MIKFVLSTTLWLCGAASLVLLAPSTGWAQSAQGALRGTVKDAQGVIPGVTVSMLNEATGVTRETVTNDSGEYSFPAVEPSAYTVKAAVPGFKSFERKGVRVSTQQQIGLDIVLEVGTLEETITVTADAPLIETTNASQGGVVDQQTLEAIPTAGRSVFLLATLEPTVQTSGNARWNRMQDQVGNSAVSIGGGPVRSNNFLVDGFPVTDLQNRASTNPSMEAVQEMKVQVHTYDAEMGRTGGGVMNMAARAGSNTYTGSLYGILRPQKLQEQLLIPKIRNQEFVPEYWRNGGGGFGGPILKNRTFFWLAGEKYVNNQPQQNSFLVPTMAERNGDFSGLTRNGQPVVIRDPLTGQAFPNNQIPVSRMDPVGRALAGYFPQPDSEVDNGSPNFSMTDLLPNNAYQFTTKLNHNFNQNISASAFVLRQVTHEANANYNPTNRFVGGSYQLDRVINTLVLNNTYVLNNSTVATLRGGYNLFDDDYNLPYDFDAAGLFNNSALTGQMSDLNRFPTLTINGYKGAGFTNRQANRYYQYGVNGTLSRLAGSHSLKAGGDFRILGQKSLNYGASTGTYTFDGIFTGNSVADLLLGYPQQGNVPINTELDGYVRYYAAFVQDDWRINEKLTLNYGVRVERETGLMERDNQFSVGFDTTTVSPLNSQVNFTDPLTGQRRDIVGGLIFAGQNGAATVQGDQPAVKIAPRIGAVYSLNDKTVLRGGWGLYWAPWNYAAAGLTGWGQTGYSAVTNIQQNQTRPTVTMSNPFPQGLLRPTGNADGLLTGTGGDIYFVDPNKGAPRVQQYSFDLQRELPGNMSVTLGYTGLTGSELSWGGSGNALINLNQMDPRYQSLLTSTNTQVPNPFLGVAAAGGYANRQTIEIGRLLRPFPQFDNVYMQQSTGAHSQYHAAIVQLRKRATGWFGGNFSYTWSRLSDNQFGQGNFYTSDTTTALQNNYTVIEGSSYYDPDSEYGRSALDTPHKIVIAPTLLLPFGEGKRFLSGSKWANRILGDWQITPVITLNSGFPIGVTQNLSGNAFLWGGTPRPNLTGVDPLAPGDITDRIRQDPNDNEYLNRAAFSTAPANQFGNAPRILPGLYSPWRNNVDLSVQKQIRTGGPTSLQLKLEVINMFNIVQWGGPTSVAFNNAGFGRITNQATNMRVVQFLGRFQF